MRLKSSGLMSIDPVAGIGAGGVAGRDTVSVLKRSKISARSS